MEYLDEELAKKMQKMREQKEELTKENDDEKIQTELVVRLKECIKEGQVNIEGKNIIFNKFKILDEKTTFYIPTNNIEILTNVPLLFQAIDNTNNISILISCNNENHELTDLEKRKQQINNSVQSMQLRCRWKKTEVLSRNYCDVQYFEYVTLTGIAIIYNVMWVYMSEEGLMTYLINFEEKDEKIWLPIIKALMEMS